MWPGYEKSDSYKEFQQLKKRKKEEEDSKEAKEEPVDTPPSRGQRSKG